MNWSELINSHWKRRGNRSWLIRLILLKGKFGDDPLPEFFHRPFYFSIYSYALNSGNIRKDIRSGLINTYSPLSFSGDRSWLIPLILEAIPFIVNSEHISHLCSSVSIVNFEQANTGWVIKITQTFWVTQWIFLIKVFLQNYSFWWIFS